MDNKLATAFLRLLVGIILLTGCSQRKQDSNEITTDEQSAVSYITSYSKPNLDDGELKGAILLGSSGFDAFTVSISKDGKWRLEKAEFGVSRVYENEASLTDIRTGLREYFDNMTAAGLDSSDIHFIVSSSAATNPKVAGIIAVLVELGFPTRTVSAEEEARYAFVAVMPEALRENGFVLDIGSGNTKIAWFENGTIVGYESYGSKYYQKQTPDGTIYNSIYALVKNIPVECRKYCFTIGGVPFELADGLPVHGDRYSILRDPAEYKTDDPKLMAGLNIYNAVKESSGTETFIFDWNSNFVIGYLLDDYISGN